VPGSGTLFAADSTVSQLPGFEPAGFAQENLKSRRRREEASNFEVSFCLYFAFISKLALTTSNANP
jgi:hypothetical protein